MSRGDLDLDAAVRESRAEPWVLRFRGERFEMPGELLAEALVVYGRFVGAQREAEMLGEDEAAAVRLESFQHLDRLTALLFASDAEFARFMALRPTEAQRQALVLEAVGRWGGSLGPGESRDSRPSSSGNGRPASPTSLQATG